MRSALVSYLIARGISMLGDGVFELAVPVLAIARTGSPALAGAAVAAQQLPGVLLGVVIGRLEGRVSRQAAIVASDVGRGSVLALVFVALALRVPIGPALIVGAVCLGIGDVASYISSTAILPSLVGRENTVAANAALEAADAVTSLSAPVLAGVLIQLASAVSCFAFDALTFLASGALLSRIFQPRMSSRSGLRNGPQSSTIRSVALMWRDCIQAATTVMQLAANAQAGSVVICLVSYLELTMHLHGVALGAVIAAAGVGGLIASAVVPRLTAARVGLVLFILVCLLAVSYALLSSTTNIPAATVSVGLLDGASAGIFILVGSVRQLTARPEDIGPLVGAALSATRAVRVVAALAAGSAVAAFGPATVLRGVAVGLLIAGIAVLAGPLHRIRLATYEQMQRP